jgi:hypothetical protein
MSPGAAPNSRAVSPGRTRKAVSGDGFFDLCVGAGRSLRGHIDEVRSARKGHATCLLAVEPHQRGFALGDREGDHQGPVGASRAAEKRAGASARTSRAQRSIKELDGCAAKAARWVGRSAACSASEERLRPGAERGP